MPIPAGSTIRKAYFFGCRVGNAPPTIAILNGTPYNFNSSNMVSVSFNSVYGGPSGIHAFDVSSVLSPGTLNYNISVTNANNTSNTFPEFYLFIAYDNPSLPTMHVSVWLNDQDFSPQLNYTLTPSVGMDNTIDVGLAIVGGYARAGTDCEKVYVNGTYLGDYHGQDFNASSLWGSMAGFGYNNGTLVGYNDDNPNLAIAGPDALSNIGTIIPNGTQNIPVSLVHCNASSSDNHLWLFLLSNGGGCTPPQLTVNVQNACPSSLSGAAQVSATGGVLPYSYFWSGGQTTNTIVGQSAGTYLVTVTDFDGCSAVDSAVIVNGIPGGLPGIWQWVGAWSSNWFNPCNWDKLELPNSLSVVIVPGFTNNNPVIAGDTANCRHIFIYEVNGGHLYIDHNSNGHLINSP